MTTTKGTFILSIERSGSSLLRVLLNEHPDIAALPETHFLPTIHRLLKSRPDKNVGKKIRKLLERNTWFRQLDLRTSDLRKVWDALEANPINETLLFDTIFQGYANKYNKTMWIEKTPLYSLYWQDILEIFPRARFIILTRDPLGYCNSMKRAKWFHLKPPLHFIIDRYKKYIQSLNTFIKQNPTLALITIDFKDLILKTDSVLTKVFRFLEAEPLTLKQLSGYLKTPDKHYAKEHLNI